MGGGAKFSHHCVAAASGSSCWCTDRGLKLHLVWTEISYHPPTHCLGSQAVGLFPEGQPAWAWRPGQGRQDDPIGFPRSGFYETGTAAGDWTDPTVGARAVRAWGLRTPLLPPSPAPLLMQPLPSPRPGEAAGYLSSQLPRRAACPRLPPPSCAGGHEPSRAG